MLTKTEITRRKHLLKNCGFILHEGTENGYGYTVIATLESKNPKTGNMIQIWIILNDVHPIDGVKTGIDASTICKGCPYASGKGCYVNTGQAPNAIYKGYKKGLYPKLTPKDYRLVFLWRNVRFGAYGNPSLIPLSIVKAIVKVASGWTGYFHDWAEMHPATRKAYGKYFMASTENTTRLAEAKRFKLRSFHVSAEQPKDTIECLNTSTGVNCERCKLCAGNAKKSKPSIWIAPHGGGGKINRTIKASLVA